jgi:hypothetical protein
MLLLLLLMALPCLFPLNVVFGVLFAFVAFPLVAGGVLTVGLMLLPPPAKSHLLTRLEAEREAAEREGRRDPSAAWVDSRDSRLRPWDKLPQWDKDVVCEAPSRTQPPQRPVHASKRAALRAAASRPIRH